MTEGEMEKLLKTHNHDGYSTPKISASCVNLNSFAFKNIKSVSLSEAIKLIDQLFDTKQKVLNGKKGSLVVYDELGTTTELDPNIFEKKNHEHSNYLTKKDKEELLSIAEVNNKNCTKNIELLCSLTTTIGEDLLDYKKHKHNEFIEKKSGSKQLLVLDEGGNLLETGINPNDIILKKDVISLVNSIITEHTNEIMRILSTKADNIHNHDSIDTNQFIKKSELAKEIKNLIME